MKHCNLCGRAINENEYRLYPRKDQRESRGLTICSDCERDKPRCAVCHAPMAADQTSIGICGDCLREGLRCRSCGARVHGDFVVVNGNDGPYCAECVRRYPRCDLCGAPASADSVTFPGGRVICGRCRETAVADQRKAQLLFERVIDLLDHALGMRLNVRPRLAIVDHSRLVELARHAAAESGHDREKALGLFMRLGRKRFIYVQEYLPQILMIQVVAHEFAHAWQGENCPLLRDPVLVEGFAEWAAYHVLLQLDAKKKAAQMVQRGDDYGEGLRRLVELEKQQGLAGVLEFCRRAA